MAYHVKKMARFRGPNLDRAVIRPADDSFVVKLKAGHNSIDVAREVLLDCGQASLHPPQMNPVLAFEELLPRKSGDMEPVSWEIKVEPLCKHPPNLVI